jgi:hypothetical protein
VSANAYILFLKRATYDDTLIHKHQEKEGQENMPKVQLNQHAPDFELNDFNGNKVRLSDFKNRNHVVLIFNRGFM